MRAQPDQEQLYSKILEKSIYEKARDRMNRNKKADDEQEQQDTSPDFLKPILKKLALDT
jgi:hypothetical protein